MKDHTCGVCKFARFPRTPTGRIRRHMCGECTYKVMWPPLPDSMLNRYGFCLPEPGWVAATGGENCACWKPAETKKKEAGR